MYKRILAIGDIHGEWGKLQSLLQKIRFNPGEDLLVLLGDYLDRGPEPLRVMGWLLANRNNPRFVALRGNHDQLMLDHYMDKDTQKAKGWIVGEKDYRDLWGSPDLWRIDYGGDVIEKALDELGGFGADLRKRWLDLVGDMPLSFQAEAGGRRFFFCHAGIDPKKPLDAQNPDDLLWGWGNDFDEYAGEATIVVGHAVWPEPLVTPKLIRTDTGACRGGPLTCVDALSGRVWQSFA